jgi:DNA-binding NarL/FixJ family response regulator
MKIGIADHEGLIRAGVHRMLAAEEDFVVTGEANTGREIVTLLEQTNPDALLLDLDMPDMDGLARIQQLRAGFPKLKIVICSASDSPVLIQAAFRRGVYGYILKRIPARDLGSAIRQGLEGTAYHALGLPALEDDAVALRAGLTHREVEIMRAVTRGLTNKEIAAELWLSVQTVKFHLTNIYRKLKITNRTEAARWALSRGIG